MKEADKKFLWKFSVDSHGDMKEPIRPVDYEKIMNQRHYFNSNASSNSSYRISMYSSEKLYFTFERATEIIYFFYKKKDAEKFIRDKMTKNVVNFYKK